MDAQFYDMAGLPLSPEEWTRRYGTQGARTVAKTRVWPGWEVSTVLLGLNHRYDDWGPPIIFETMVFHAAHGGRAFRCRRYCTRSQAKAGHAHIVRQMQWRIWRGLWLYLRR